MFVIWRPLPQRVTLLAIEQIRAGQPEAFRDRDRGMPIKEHLHGLLFELLRESAPLPDFLVVVPAIFMLVVVAIELSILLL